MANLQATPEKQPDGSIKTVLRHPRPDSVWTLHFQGGTLDGQVKLYPYLPDTFAKHGQLYDATETDKAQRTAILVLREE